VKKHHNPLTKYSKNMFLWKKCFSPSTKPDRFWKPVRFKKANFSRIAFKEVVFGNYFEIIVFFTTWRFGMHWNTSLRDCEFGYGFFFSLFDYACWRGLV